MDLSLVLSIVAIVVSVSMSIITLLLTEFRGPNISLLNAPEFDVSDEYFDETQILEYTPRWFKLKPVPFVFTNHGGKSGTIVDLKLDFVPHSSFKGFFERFYSRFEGLRLPVTIKEGDNQFLKISPTIYTINWKKIALAEVLDRSLKVDDIIEEVLERSKERFRRFCDFLDKSQELGKVSCTITLTKGRFRTKVTKEKLFENITIANQYDKAVSSLRDCLRRWENLRPTKAELLNEVMRGFEQLVGELKGNLLVLANPLSEYDVSHKAQACKLRVDGWNQLRHIRTLHDRKIRWFLIKSEEGLDEDLTKLYKNLVKYNSSIDELMSLGELRTPKHFRSINAERENLRSGVEEMWERLCRLHRRSIS